MQNTKKTTASDPMQSVLNNIEKSMGSKNKKSPFMRFGEIEKEEVPVIPFGLPEIDDASYCGGVPRGKMIEIFGPESSGKSLLSLHLIAGAQKQGLDCALLDVEQSFDPNWAALQGVDINKLLYSNEFSSGENALEYAYRLCESGSFGLVVIDSTAALTPLSELEGTLEDNARVGEQARMMSRGCRKIIDACGKGNTTCVFINQIRMKIGVMYGNPETTPGGLALKFYSHQRIRVNAKTKITVKEAGQDKVVGLISKVTFVKNKAARPWGNGEFKIIFDSTALNPVLMLANNLRSAKLVTVYNQVFRIAKDVLDNAKPIDTGATTMVALADYLVKKELVLPLLDKLIEVNANIEEIDAAILEMKENKSKIVSPLEIAAGKQVSNAETLSEIEEVEVTAAEAAEEAEEV